MDLTNLTLDELKKFVAEAETLIRRKEYEAKQDREKLSRTELKSGDIVTLTSDRFNGEVWEVLKLNPKKVQCRRGNGEVWNIPYAHIIMG